MRTTLNLDDRAVEQAMMVSEGKTKTQIINEALLDYARRKRLRGLLRLRGKEEWEGNLERLRKRS